MPNFSGSPPARSDARTIRRYSDGDFSTPEALSRKATVTGAGNPRERTAHTYAQWLANHEHSHIKQIERIVTTLHM